MKIDVLITGQTNRKGRELLNAILAGAQALRMPARLVSHNDVRPDRVLMLYGAGGPDRMPTIAKQIQAGGTVIMWDAGYWHRSEPTRVRKYRVSINEMHPQRRVMEGPIPVAARWDAAGLPIEQVGGDPTGPVLLVGNSPKSCAIGARGWAAQKSAEIRTRWPGRQLIYRPKPKRPHDVGVSHDGISTEPIALALAKVSLVVCRHSNVAVDACRQGVPVVCDDGAAAAIYPGALADEADQPDLAERQEFLHRLAWWQWSPDECARGELWPWLGKQLKGMP